MNAFRLRPVVQRFSAIRAQSTMASKAFPPRDTATSFRKAWLSEPATYPIIFIMGAGFAWVFGMSANALFTYRQGVDISPTARGSVLKNYSTEHRTGFVERLVGDNVQAPEGVAVDHQEWTKQKQVYKGN
eukprot:Nitzschia sp. Nitz4//scaffold220_size35126//5128//5517//NITZ4_007829-RA/size35126-processed-gene-0.13-mRNA-1//-1//CDS//3329542526//5563//frame0